MSLIDFLKRRGRWSSAAARGAESAAEPAAEAAPFEPVARSAFRVLGLAAGASRREVSDAASSVRLALKVGVRKSFDADLAWLGQVGREESDVRDATGRLSEPSQRAFERLFWFEEPPTALHVSNVEELGRAVSALSPDETGAPHDAALLALAGLVRLDPELSAPDAWARAFALWRRVFESEEFWPRLVAADLRGDFEQLATYAEVRKLRERAPRVVSRPVVERARDAAVRNDAGECGRALGLLRGARLPPALLDEYERETLGPLEDALTERIDAAFGWLYIVTVEARGAATVRNYANEVWRKFKAVSPDLSEFVRAAGASHYAARRLLEHTSAKLILLSERFEQASRREESLFVALKAHAIAPPASEARARARERLCAVGAGDAGRETAEDGHADAPARELSDTRAPAGLFKDDPAGERTMDSFFRALPRGGVAPARKGSDLWNVLLVCFGVALMCISSQRCGLINTRPSRTYPGGFPPPTYTPFQMNYNYNLNLNLNIQPYPMPTPLVLEEPGRPARRRRRRANRRDPNANAPGSDAQNGNALKWPPPAP